MAKLIAKREAKVKMPIASVQGLHLAMQVGHRASLLSTKGALLEVLLRVKLSELIPKSRHDEKEESDLRHYLMDAIDKCDYGNGELQ